MWYSKSVLVRLSPSRAGLKWKLTHDSDTPVYVQIMERVREAVDSGTLAPNDGLPSVRTLARELSVNPNTVARAYDELQREGVVRGEPGRGVFVSAGWQNLSRAGTVLLLCDAESLPEDEPNFGLHSVLRAVTSELADE